MSFDKRVAENISNLNDTDKKILEYISGKYTSFKNEKLASIAKGTFTSPNAIVRFAKKLDYNGFSEMKYAILSNTKKTFTELHEHTDYYAVGTTLIKGMEKTLNINREDVFMKIVQEISSAKKIIFFALGITTNTTRTFIQKLEHYNKLCLLPTDRDNALTLAKNLDNDFLAVFITLSGKTDVLIQCANILKQKNVQIISITGLGNNYIQDISTLSLYTQTDNYLSTSTDLQTRLYIDFILEILFNSIAQSCENDR